MSSEQISAFLEGKKFAVAGASRERTKYGNKVLRVYQQKGRDVYPINPHVDSVEGMRAYADLGSVPEKVDGVSIITPPAITERIVDQAIELGIKNLWIQPGAESPVAIKKAVQAGLNVIADGSCILVVLGFREHAQ